MSAARPFAPSGQDEAALVAEAHRLALQGRSQRQIAAALGRSRHWVRYSLAKPAVSDSASATEIEPQTATEYAERITACWRRALTAGIETGRLLLAAKDRLPHGEFGLMIAESLPFGERYAQRLMAIARDPRIANPKHASLLPVSPDTLYQLTRLDDAAFAAAIADGTIRPDIERSEVIALSKALRTAPLRAAHAARVAEGCTVDDLHDLAESGKRFGAILADPAWKFLTRSEKGEDRSASQHYTTSTFEQIKAMPVHQLAADDCALFLWIVDWFPLQLILELIASWGFEHKTTAFTWAKTNPDGEGWHMGQGYWTRANPEVCLLCTRGKPERLNADVRQLIVAPVMEHSAKPDETHDRIARLVAGPYLELFARKPRPRWFSWGNEIARSTMEPRDPTESTQTATAA